MKLVVLASGEGSNLQAILDAIAEGRLDAEVVAVVVNRKDARALERAERADVSTAYAPFKPYKDAGRPREDYDADLADLVASLDPDWVVLAGWMHVFTPAFLDRFPGRVLNLHPALPGTFPGKDGLGDALEAWREGRIDHTGCMVHVVVPEVDAGPVLATAVVPFVAGDTRETLAARVHAAEHRLLVEVLQALAEQRSLPEQ